jgi:hypothetical protein
VFPETGRHFPIFVLMAFNAFAQPTLISFSCSLRHPITLPPPGVTPGHNRATSDLQYARGSAALAVRVSPGSTITPSESNAAKLQAVAQQHAYDMARRNSLGYAGFMRHRGPAGAAAENLAVGGDTEACARRMWMQSPRT